MRGVFRWESKGRGITLECPLVRKRNTTPSEAPLITHIKELPDCTAAGREQAQKGSHCYRLVCRHLVKGRFYGRVLWHLLLFSGSLSHAIPLENCKRIIWAEFTWAAIVRFHSIHFVNVKVLFH